MAMEVGLAADAFRPPTRRACYLVALAASFVVGISLISNMGQLPARLTLLLSSDAGPTLSKPDFRDGWGSDESQMINEVQGLTKSFAGAGKVFAANQKQAPLFTRTGHTLWDEHHPATAKTAADELVRQVRSQKTASQLSRFADDTLKLGLFKPTRKPTAVPTANKQNYKVDEYCDQRLRKCMSHGDSQHRMMCSKNMLRCLLEDKSGPKPPPSASTKSASVALATTSPPSAPPTFRIGHKAKQPTRASLQRAKPSGKKGDVAKAASQGGACYEQRTDYHGNDILHMSKIPSANMCQVLCSKLQQCEAFTLYKTTCYLKSAKQVLKGDKCADCVSGPKACL